jgi:hypothetical protein
MKFQVLADQWRKRDKSGPDNRRCLILMGLNGRLSGKKCFVNLPDRLASAVFLCGQEVDLNPFNVYHRPGWPSALLQAKTITNLSRDEVFVLTTKGWRRQ